MNTLETMAQEAMESHSKLHDSPCDLDVDTAWPYECIARDENPSNVVVICRTHVVWTHFKRPVKRCVNCNQAIPHSAIAYCDRCN